MSAPKCATCSPAALLAWLFGAAAALLEALDVSSARGDSAEQDRRALTEVRTQPRRAPVEESCSAVRGLRLDEAMAALGPVDESAGAQR